MNFRGLKNLILTVFAFVLLSVCFAFETQAAMSDKEVKNRLSAYSESYVKSEDGVCYLEYEKWDSSEDEMYKVISTITKSLMGEPIKDFCTVNLKFFFTHEIYGDDFNVFFENLTRVKKMFGNFWTEWSRYNKLSMSVTSYKGGEYFSANFVLNLNGSEQDRHGKKYDEKLLSLVRQARETCRNNMEVVQFFLEWLDENASYLILTGYSNDPRYALLVGYTVCGGYANAFKDLCNAAGIPAIVPVNLQANHAWSQVYVSGTWYTADLCNVVKSKSDTYNGYLFTDPDMPFDCKDFVEKHKKEYVNSYKYKDTVDIDLCKITYENTYNYTGKSIKPTLKVTFGKKTLKAGTHYNIVYTDNKYPGKGKIILEGIKKNGYKGSRTLTFKITLPKTKVTSFPGKKTVELSWKKIKGADGYIIRFYNEKTKKYESLDTVTGTTCKIKNLSPGKKYKFAVVAFVSEKGKKHKSANSKVTISTLPDKVKKVRAGSVKEASLKLKWSAVESAQKYEIQISTDGKKWKKKTTANSNSCTIKNLKSNRKYFFRVRAINSSGKGSYSDIKTVYTLPPKPKAKVSAGKGKFTAEWKKIENVNGYEVCYSANKDMKKSKTVTVKKSSKTSAVIKGLKKGKNYYVKVRAYKTVNGEKIYGKYSATMKVTVK